MKFELKVNEIDEEMAIKLPVISHLSNSIKTHFLNYDYGKLCDWSYLKSIIIMNESLQEFIDRENGILHFRSGKWYNGNTYMPLEVYNVSIPYKDWQIEIRYEWKLSEFNKASAVNYSQSFQNRFSCEIQATSNTPLSFAPLSIQHQDRILGLFKRNNPFKIKCAEPEINNPLIKSTELLQLGKCISERADFSPVLYGSKKGASYTLSAHFLVVSSPVEALEAIFPLFRLLIDLVGERSFANHSLTGNKSIKE